MVRVSERSPRVTVRTARPGDEPALAALDARAWSPTAGFPSTFRRATAPFFDERNPPHAHLVAEEDGVLVGYARLRAPTPLPENAHVLGLHGLAVTPVARGRGVAGALLDAVERAARERGARKLSLRVLSTNEPARRLYERHGYVVEGVLRGEFVIQGRSVDDVVMAKHLG
jgi:ribosomal protein S18 acetylase RimI-like enzyme